MQFTIEARELTGAYTREPQHVTIEAQGPDDAISRFVAESHSELVSLVQPAGRESIATIRKDDSVYLVRVYAN